MGTQLSDGPRVVDVHYNDSNLHQVMRARVLCSAPMGELTFRDILEIRTNCHSEMLCSEAPLVIQRETAGRK